MGKKTDAFTASLAAKADDMDEALSQAIDACKAYAEAMVEWHSEQKKGDYNSPEFLKIDASVDQAMSKGRQLRRDLRKAINDVADVVSDFNIYITKKEKSKNPFRGKKSVPQAKQTITAYRASITQAEDALSKISNMFPT